MTQFIKGRWLWQFQLMFIPRDWIVGVFWSRYPAAFDISFCLLPLRFNVYVQNMRPTTVTEPNNGHP